MPRTLIHSALVVTDGFVRQDGWVLFYGKTIAATGQDPAVLADKPVGDDAGGVDQCAWHQATMTSMPQSANAPSPVALMALSVMNASESESLGNEVSVGGQQLITHLGGLVGGQGGRAR